MQILKILAVASTMDLGKRLGCTPAWWQLWKALHEIGHEIIVTPYLGDPVETLWWRTYPNPCLRQSLLFNRYLNARRRKGKQPGERTVLSPVFNRLIELEIRPRWREHLRSILQKEKDVDVVLFMAVPLNHIRGIPSQVIEPLGIPSVFYDGDMPSILPEHAVERGFRFSYYEGADLSEFKFLLVNSDAVVSRLVDMGAQKVFPFHYAADPELFAPVATTKVADVSYFALSSVAREEWMTKLIALPSRRLPKRRFCVAGGPFRVDLGSAKYMGDLTYAEYRNFCCGSVLCLNITSGTHASARGTSTSRPFELAALESCIISQPYDGIEAWFEPGKEILIVQDEEEATETYEQLLNDPEQAAELGRRARERILKDHTYRHRALELVEHLKVRT